MHRIRVILVDDHPIVRDGVRDCLQRDPDIEVIGVAGDGAGALRLVKEPDVLLLDLHLPDLSGFEVARRVRAGYPSVAVLILTGYDEVGYIRGLLELGVRGFLSKTVPSEEILAAVRTVANGKTILTSDAVQAAREKGAVVLTERERHVLQLLGSEWQNARIATALMISEKTVEFHVSRLLSKLRARSRTEAVRKALHQGIILEAHPEG